MSQAEVRTAATLVMSPPSSIFWVLTAARREALVLVRRVIGLLESLSGRRAHVERRPSHPADVRAAWADITQARRLLGWAPHTSLEDGLRAAVGWYAENRAWASQLALGN